MFSKIKHLSVKGGKFLESTNFELFSDKRNLRVIYGKNGSGKSTITKSILNINNSYDLDISGKFLDNSMNEISITEEMAKNIFVFNEEYIEKNIKLKENGLGTIVMFGEQPELNNEIEEIEKKIIEINKEKILISQKRENLGDERAIIYNNILESLKGDLNWAGRDKEIKKNKANSSVNISVIENICSRNPKDSRKETISAFIYKKSIEKVSSDLKIISELDIAYQEYFKNYMYKLFLNGESHLEETVCSHLDMTFTEITSADEKKRVARDIICFMYLLNKNHILAYLENVEAIESWCNDIKNSYNNLKQTTL